MKVHVEHDEKYPDFYEAYSPHPDDEVVELTEEEVEEWRKARNVVAKIEEKIKAQMGWDR